MNLICYALSFQSVVGPVKEADIGSSLSLMGRGMLGIFVVMLLIYAVIAALNRTTKHNDES